MFDRNRSGSEVKSGTKVLENQTYEYNELGDIESIHRTGAIKDSRVAQERIKFDKTSPLDTITYSYDDRNQLVREDNPFVGRTYTFAYDDGGNIIEKGEYAYSVQSVPARPAGELLTTHTYAYDEENTDLLVEYDGQEIVSDEQSNPTKYKGNHVTWEKGRRMASYGKMKYRYNPSGSRIGKSDGDTKTAYYLDGTRLIREETISDSNRPYVPGALESIDYHYDGHGTLASLSMKCYNRSVAEYYYLRNTLGDVVALCDAVGNIVAAYEYDAWGGVHGVYDGFGVNRINEQDFVGNLNPIRYRGYYYDTETALYYLQSRYFDPGTGRFVNADAISVLDGGNDHILENNLFVYCFNNPVNALDNGGSWPQWATNVLIGVAVIAVCVAITVATGGAGAGVAGFIAAGALKGALIGAATGAAIGAGAGAVNHRIQEGSWQGAGKAALEGGANGFMTGSITGAVTGAVGSSIKVVQAAQSWGATTTRTPLQNMSSHYAKHVIDEGHTYLGKNVVQYTKNANSLFTANQSAMKLTSSGNYAIRATLTGKKVGGFFSGTGKVFSFY